MLSDEDKKQIIELISSWMSRPTNSQDRLTRLIDILVSKNTLTKEDKVIINNRRVIK